MNEADINDVVRQAIGHVLTNGLTYTSSDLSMNKGSPICEAFNTHATWTNPRRRMYVGSLKAQPFRIGLAVARVFYLLSGSNQLAPISFYTAGVTRFSDDGITIPGSSYGHRIFGLDETGGQFERVADLIKTRPDTKRGEIVIYWPHDAGRQSNDIPCVSNIVFMPRNDILHMTLQMRANDALKLLPYNLFEFSILMECMSAQAGLKLGNLHHTAVSLHLRGQDIDLVKEISGSAESPSMPNITTFSNSMRIELVEIEQLIRTQIAHQGVEPAWEWYKQIKGTFEPLWQDLIGVLLLEAFRSVQTCSKDLLWLQTCMLETLQSANAIQSYYVQT